MEDVIHVGNDTYTLAEYDLLFERATEEGERKTYEERQNVLALMELSPEEECVYEKLRQLKAKAAHKPIDPLLQKEIALCHKGIKETERYWQYVYAKQSESYHIALQKKGIDLDSVEPEYKDDELVQLFREHFVLSEIYPPTYVPLGYTKKKKNGQIRVVPIKS